MATNTKVVDGKTYYQMGDTWSTVDRSKPNQAQTAQMQTQLQQNGTVSDSYKKQFGLAPVPTYNYYTPPTNYGTDSQGKPHTEQQWLNNGGLNQLMGKGSYSASKTNDGRYLDTTNLTGQQSYAASLWDDVAAGKKTNASAMTALAGMGLDKYGNQALPSGYSYAPMASSQTSSATTSGAIQTAPTSVYGTQASGANATQGASTSGLTASQQSAQDYITKSGKWGTVQDYATNNINRYNRGEITYDALLKDAQRVGYSIPDGSATTATLAPLPTSENPQADDVFSPGSYGGYDPAAQERAYMDMQLAALNGQSEAARLAAQFGLDQNKAYLNEQLASLGEEQTLARQNLLEQQNRFGGLYSGGVNYQGAMQDRSFGAARSGLTRDVAARNQQLLDQYGNQANAIAQQIQALQFSAPDIIRQRIQSWIDSERNYGLNYAGTFGSLGDKQTVAAQQLALDQAQREWENRFAYGQATGTFSNGQKTLSKVEQEWNQNFNQAQFDWNKAQQTWENTFKTKSFEQDMKDAAASRGLQWASLDQRQKEFVADQAFREKQYTQELGEAAGKRVSGAIDQLQGQYVQRDPSTGNVAVSNPTALRNAIIAKGLSDKETDEILIFFGLPTN